MGRAVKQVTSTFKQYARMININFNLLSIQARGLEEVWNDLSQVSEVRWLVSCIIRVCCY